MYSFLFRLIGVLFFFYGSFACSALIEQKYPYVQSYSIKYLTHYMARLTVSNSVLSVYVEENDLSSNSYTKMPRADIVSWGVGFYYTDKTGYYRLYKHIAAIPIYSSNTDNVSELGLKVINKYGYTMSVDEHQGYITSIYADRVYCVGWGGVPTSNDGWNYESKVDKFRSLCSPATPPPRFCDVITPTITLDHGTITLDLGVHEATTVVPIRCSGAARVTLSLKENVLKMGDGIQSTLSFPEGNTRNMTSAGGEIPLRSTLAISSLHQAAGNLEGSTVLTVEYD